MKDKIFGVLQRVGRSFMLPIALLPIAGLLLGIGSSFTNPTTIETYRLSGIIYEGGVLYTILEGIRICAVELEAFIPSTSKRIYEQLGVSDASFENNDFGYVNEYKVTAKPEILFNRIDEKELAKKIEEENREPEPVVEKTPEITIDDFAKIELKVGEVIECHKHPKADKLLVEKVDLGSGDIRQIVSGIAAYYKPEEMIGKKVVVVSNLKEANLRGEKSQGMLLCAEKGDKVELITSTLEKGSKVR